MMPATTDCGRTVMDVVVWLRSLGLGKYEAAFRAPTEASAQTSFCGKPQVISAICLTDARGTISCPKLAGETALSCSLARF